MEIKKAIELLEEVAEFDDSMYAYNPAYNEALQLAISALEKQEADRWIPVTERLPEEPDEVLVTDGDGEIRHAVYCHVCKKDVFITYEESMTIYEVLAWRPLPEPYTEEES